MAIPDPPQQQRELLAAELRRVSERVRTLSQSRLEPHLGSLRAAAQTLIDCAVECEGNGGDGRPDRGRAVPEVAWQAWADLLTVLANDVLQACEGSNGRPTAALGRAAAALTQLRRTL